MKSFNLEGFLCGNLNEKVMKSFRAFWVDLPGFGFESGFGFFAFNIKNAS